jgi:hypothetical protein
VGVSKKKDTIDKNISLPAEVVYCDESDKKYKVEIYRPLN